MMDEKSFPNILHAILLVSILFGIQVFLGIVIVGISLILKIHNLVQNPVISGILILVSFSSVLILFVLLSKESFRKVFPFRPFRLYILAPMFVFFLGLSIILSEADNILQYFMPMPLFLKQIIGDLLAPGIFSFIMVIIIGPLMEELFFRGVILRGFLKQYKVRKSILVSSLIFTLYHMNPYQFLAAFVLGILLGWIYVKTNSVWLCFLSHAIYNSFIFSARLWVLSIPGYTLHNTEMNSVYFQPWWFNLAGFILIAIGFWGILKTLPITFSFPEQSPHTDLGNQSDLTQD